MYTILTAVIDIRGDMFMPARDEGEDAGRVAHFHERQCREQG